MHPSKWFEPRSIISLKESLEKTLKCVKFLKTQMLSS